MGNFGTNFENTALKMLSFLLLDCILPSYMVAQAALAIPIFLLFIVQAA